MVNKFRPLGNRIFVKIEKEIKNEAGIYISFDGIEESPFVTGKVVALGNKMATDKIKVDDTVYFERSMATEIEEDYLIINEDNIMGIIGQ